jgi:hypothetical protein
MGSCYERRVLMVLGPFIHLDALNMDMYTSVIQHLLDRQHPSAYPSSGSFFTPKDMSEPLRASENRFFCTLAI